MRVDLESRISQISKTFYMILNNKQCNELEDSFNNVFMSDPAHIKLKYYFNNLDLNI